MWAFWRPHRGHALAATVLYSLFAPWASATTLKIGLLLPFSYDADPSVVMAMQAIQSGVALAISDLNQNRNMFPGTPIELVLGNSWNSSSDNVTSAVSNPSKIAILQVLNMTQDIAVNAVIGDFFMQSTIWEGFLSSSGKIIQSSPVASSVLLSVKNDYPYYFSTRQSVAWKANGIADFINASGWKSVAIVHGLDDEYGLAGMQSFLNRVDYWNITLLISQPVYTSDPYTGNLTSQDRDNLNQNILNLRTTEPRIIFVCASPSDTEAIYYTARSMNMVGPDYVWLGIGPLDFSPPEVLEAMYGLNAVQDKDGFIFPQEIECDPIDPVNIAFVSRWMGLNSQNPTEYPVSSINMPYDFARISYDTVNVIASGWKQTMNTYNFTAQAIASHQADGYLNWTAFASTGYRGPTGQFVLDSTGNRKGSMIFLAQTKVDGQANSIGKYITGNLVLPVGFYGYGGRVVPPSDMPVCQAGYWSFQANGSRPQCVACDPGTYNMKRNSTCKSCPQGAICNGESDVRPLANYWMDPSIKDVASAFLECQFEGPCCPNGNCTSDQACKPGFTGPLCAQCEATAPYQWGGGCFSCSSSSPGWPTLAFLLVFLGTGLYYFLPKLEGFFVSDLAVFYQVSRYLVSLANPFMPLLSALTLNVDISYGLSWCIMPINDATKLSLNLGLPFILAAMLSLWYGFDLALATWKRFMAESQESGATPVPGWLYTSKKHQNAVTSALGLFLLCYTPLVSICFTLFSCRSANQLSLLTFQPGVGCWNGPHIAMLSVGVIVLAAIIIAVPVVILLKTYRQELVDPRKQQGFIGAILAPFRLRYIWYIHVFLFERFLIPLIRISYGVDEWNQTISLFFLIWVWLMPWAFLQPYTSVIDNTLKVGTHLCALGLCSLKLVRIASSENPINLNMGNSALLVSWNDTVLWECVFLLAPLLLLPYKIFQAKYPILARNIEGRSEDKGPEAAEDANPKSARFKSTGGNLN